jgi:hypothetical protein
MTRKWFTYVENCRECMIHGEYHNRAVTSLIPDQPETERYRCMRCRARAKITDGSVQVALLDRIKKRARRNLKDVRRIAHLLSPAEKQRIIDRNAEVLAAMNELIRMVQR